MVDGFIHTSDGTFGERHSYGDPARRTG